MGLLAKLCLESKSKKYGVESNESRKFLSDCINLVCLYPTKFFVVNFSDE